MLLASQLGAGSGKHHTTNFTRRRSVTHARIGCMPTVRHAGRNVSVATAVLFPSQSFARVGIADDHRASAVLETFFLLHSHFFFLHCGADI